MVEIWWKYLSFQGIGKLRDGFPRNAADFLLVLGFAACQFGAVFAMTPRWISGIAVAIIVPFLIWNWMMGFIIYNHHTNPSVRFFHRRSEWRFYEGQVQGTVHTIFPRPFGLLLYQIMEHTAHHIDVRIPCYRLRAAQRFLEQHLPNELIVEKWSLRTFAETLRTCQLYDYDRHQWVSFARAQKGLL